MSEQFFSNYGARQFQSIFPTDFLLPICKTKNVVYLLECKKCGLQYVGETYRDFHLRVNEHKSTFKLRGKTILAKHFYNSCCSNSYFLRIIEVIEGEPANIKTILRDREEFWIKKLKTQYPFGFNTAERRMGASDTAWGNFYVNPNTNVRRRGKRKGRSLRKILEIDKYISEIHRLFNISPKETLRKLHRDLFTSTRKSIKSLYSAIINRNSSLIDHFIRDICIFRMNSFRRILNNAVTQNAISFNRRPIFKLHYSNKGFDFFNFHKIFKLGELNRYLPEDVPKEVFMPKIFFSYEKPFCLSLFNYRPTAISNSIHRSADSDIYCDCNFFSDLVEPHYGHVITGNTKITDDPRLRYLLDSGPKFRVPSNIDWNDNRKVLLDALDSLAKRMCNRFLKHKHFILELFDAWRKNTELEIERCRSINNHERKIEIPYHAINRLKNKFVITTTDKAPQNYSFICKSFYVNKIHQILDGDSTYKKCNFSVNNIKRQLIDDCHNSFEIKVPENLDIPFIQILPKFHKNPIDFRVIITSNKACTKPASKLVSTALKLIDSNVKKYCDAIYRNTGIQCYWIINNNAPILKNLEGFSKENSAKSISTFDFGQMYTNLHHSDIIRQMDKVLSIAFGKFKYLWIGESVAKWYEPKNSKSFLKVDKFTLLKLIEFVVRNTYFQFGEEIYKQEIGIPMGTDCAPWVANLTLFAYEFTYMTNKIKTNELVICRKLSHCFRFIDDITAINDDGLFEKLYKGIYPNTLILKKVNDNNCNADVLDICISVINNKFVCKLYDKRQNFPFQCNKFPCIESNIASSCKYNIFPSQMFRYFSIISNPNCLINAIRRLIYIFKEKGYNVDKLRKSGIRFINKNRIKFAHKFSPTEFHSIMRFFNETKF